MVNRAVRLFFNEMTPEQIQIIKTIVREELADFRKSDRYTIGRTLVMMDARDIETNINTGTKIATAAAQKMAFWGQTPVNQPDAVSDPSGGSTVDTQARAQLIALIGRLEEIGIIAS